MPAHCSACGSYSHARRASGGVGFVVAAFAITAGGFVASALQAASPVLIGIAVAVAFYIGHWHRVELDSLSPELVSKARRTENMTSLALLLSLFIS